MVQFLKRMYGPGATPGSRVLLAVPGVDYSPADAAAIEAASMAEPTTAEERLETLQTFAVAPALPPSPASAEPPTAVVVVDGVPQLSPEEAKAAADEALAAMKAAVAAGGAPEPPGGDAGADVVVVGTATGGEPVVPAGADQLETLGGGWYKLPNGERVKGKAAAEQALLALLQAPG